MLPLSGVTVVVTRPAHQAEKLCQHIEAAGGKVIRFPVLDIGPQQDPQKCQAQLARLAEIDLAIFVSANAVNAAFALQPTWPPQLSIAAVGKATAHALARHQQAEILVAPEPFNSEALLRLPELQSVDGKRVMIFRGEGGREFLRDRLLERGAEVDYAECYQRVLPQTDTAPLYAAWQQGQTMPIVVTSNQSLQNLHAMVNQDHRATLLASPLILISERTATLAKELGFTQAPVVAAAANDDAMLTALTHWAES